MSKKKKTCYPINQLCKVIDCEHKTAPYVELSEYLVVRTNNVRSGILVLDDIKYTTKESFIEWTQRAVPEYGDVLFTREAPAGETCLVPQTLKVCMGQRMVLLRPNKDIINSHFLSFYLTTKECRREIYQYVIGSTVMRINIDDILQIKIFCPPIAEQEKIASFLGAIDQRLTQLRRKYELLQTYKRGVMQKIFSQEIRFPEFKNDWIYSTLGKVTKYTKGFAFKSEDYLDNGIRIIRASDLDNQRIRQENQKVCVSEEFAENDKIKKYTVYKGNIIISTVGSKPELRSSAVGRGVYVCSDSEGLLNQNLLKFENIEDVNNRFLFAQINTSRYVDYISSIQRGNANQSNITVKDLLDYQIFITSLEEQEKIADFLTAIDRKIEAVAQQIDRTKQFKKGLLQKMFV